MELAVLAGQAATNRNSTDQKKDKAMKTNSDMIKTSLIACAAFALALTINAAEQMKPMKGSEHLLMVNQIKSKEDLNALKTGDSLAMVCAKCKTVWVTRVKQGVKGAQLLSEQGQPTELIGSHACKGCNSTWTVVGHAKGDITELKHSCKSCGDDSAFCCATKPGSGATKGMEKENK
jgi:hypothetical protein